MSFINFSEIPVQLLAGIFLVYAACLTEMYFCTRWFQRIVHHKSGAPTENLPPVSVLVCVRYELENIRLLIPAVLQQDYPDFELIVVADRPDAALTDFLKTVVSEYKNFRFLVIDEVPAGLSPKKFALRHGIKEAKNPVLLFTDADCLPAGSQWIRSMAGLYDESADAVIGLGNYRQEPGLLNMLIRFDTLITGALFIGKTLAGKAIGGVGRNLSYRKSLFTRSGGFTAHAAVLSGDDDLFINSAALPGRVKVCFSEEGRTVSEPEKTWSGWFSQKIRHFSAGRYYQAKGRLLLGLFHSSRLFFWFAGLVLCLLPDGLTAFLILTAFRMIYFLPVIARVAHRFGIILPLLVIPVLDFLYTIIAAFLGLWSVIFPPRKWS